MGCTQSKLPPHRLHRRRRRCCCNSSPSSDADIAGDSIPRIGHLLTGTAVGSAAVPAANLTLYYSSLTQRGHYPDSPNRRNQDAFLIETHLQSNPNLHLFAVFDGHGQFGAECAEFVRETLARILSNDPNLAENPTKSFLEAFEAANALLRSSDIDDFMSGTTAVAVLVSGASLYIANVGDSRAVAGVRNAERNCVLAEDLSCDQTPFRKDEYERVRGCGARVLSVDQVEGVKDPEVQSWGEEEDDEGDPPRLWVQGGLYPGTAFTRSVGDAMAERIGVIAVPEVKEVKITPEHLFFVVASDGVFEFLSSQTVVNMVSYLILCLIFIFVINLDYRSRHRRSCSEVT